MMRLSAAMTGGLNSELAAHLLRSDGQEDLCFAMWRSSTGHSRKTAVIERPILPRSHERNLHGNVSFEAAYALRAAQEAAGAGMGLAFLHSHPSGRAWQTLNQTDELAERRIANLARELTELPLVGLTLAGDGGWSARIWKGVGRDAFPESCESVRVIGDSYQVTFNDELVPIPKASSSQARTVHTWGEHTQANIARLRVAVAGTGSVGMTILDVLGRTGIQSIGVFEFDTVEMVNLDRLRGASRLDALLKRPKTHIAERLLFEGSTAANPSHEIYELSVCEPVGFARLLDFDLVFSCVDRPWPRHVLNTMAYADLIPVIEGGLGAFQNSDGSFRNAYWSSTLVRPGRPCLACLGQYDPALVQVERDGSLDDPSYIANLPQGSPLRQRQNVAALSTSVSAALLDQFVTYVAHPSGIGDAGPLRFNLRDHKVDSVPAVCDEMCSYQADAGCGDARPDPTARHMAAEEARRDRAVTPMRVKASRRLDDLILKMRRGLQRTMSF